MTRLKWKLVSVLSNIVLILTQDRCTICVEYVIFSKNILDAPDATDEDINPDTGMATPTEPAQAPPGPLTRARARELNFMMILKNEGPEVS